MSEQYIIIMIQSLEQKLAVLNQIEAYNLEQTEILKQETISWEAFDQNADQKMDCIARLDKLDEGFEQLFQRLSEQFKDPTFQQAHKAEIKRLQDLIHVVVDKSVSLQAMESRNKQLVEQHFQKRRESLGKQRATSKRAMDYYQTMRQANVTMPQFLDSKK